MKTCRPDTGRILGKIPDTGRILHKYSPDTALLQVKYMYVTWTGQIHSGHKKEIGGRYQKSTKKSMQTVYRQDIGGKIHTDCIKAV